MVDFLSPEERSQRMSRIRSTNTKAEVIAFRYLRRQGVYFQKYYNRVPGKPDIALPRKKRAVFIDGDFWHGKTIQRVQERGPDDYWTKKILRNMERDKAQEKELLAKGWRILRIWERDILRKSTQEQTLEKIRIFLLHEGKPGDAKSDDIF